MASFNLVYSTSLSSVDIDRINSCEPCQEKLSDELRRCEAESPFNWDCLCKVPDSKYWMGAFDCVKCGGMDYFGTTFHDYKDFKDYRCGSRETSGSFSVSKTSEAELLAVSQSESSFGYKTVAAKSTPGSSIISNSVLTDDTPETSVSWSSASFTSQVNDGQRASATRSKLTTHNQASASGHKSSSTESSVKATETASSNAASFSCGLNLSALFVYILSLVF